MWTFKQSNGEFLHDGTFIGTGYSGTGEGRNNPSMEFIKNVGPIPRGKYTIGSAYDHPTLGSCVMNLTPCSGTETFDRDLFRIHGNNRQNDASHGCIVLGPSIRDKIAESDDRELLVIP